MGGENRSSHSRGSFLRLWKDAEEAAHSGTADTLRTEQRLNLRLGIWGEVWREVKRRAGDSELGQGTIRSRVRMELVGYRE